ncbi:MAG: hypothetical protein M3326_05155 [Actinomycetota bacterium]|nr:hypothetical protein [Actinomycetota bacterium]
MVVAEHIDHAAVTEQAGRTPRHLGQRLLVLHRTGERARGFGQQGQAGPGVLGGPAGGGLGRVGPRPVEGLRALGDHGGQEPHLVGVEDLGLVERETDGADDPSVDDQGKGGGGVVGVGRIEGEVGVPAVPFVAICARHRRRRPRRLGQGNGRG